MASTRAARPASFDAVLATAREALDTQRQRRHHAVQALRQAVEEYARVSEQALAAEVARRLDLGAPRAPSASAAAERLLALVRALPELGASPTAVGVESAPASGDAEGAAPREGREPPVSVAAAALLEELRRAELGALPLPLFKARLRELGLRAQLLRVDDERADEAAGRVLERLRAEAARRGLRQLAGLTGRRGTGDLRAELELARAERERLERGARGLTQRLDVRPPATPKPAHRAKPAPSVVAVTAPPPPLARLREAARAGAVVIVGGEPERDKLEWLEQRCGFVPEWVAPAGHTRGVQALEGRILDGHVAALVLLEERIAHQHSTPIVAAARQTGTPLAHGHAGGQGGLEQALTALERALGGR